MTQDPMVTQAIRQARYDKQTSYKTPDERKKRAEQARQAALKVPDTKQAMFYTAYADELLADDTIVAAPQSRKKSSPPPKSNRTDRVLRAKEFFHTLFSGGFRVPARPAQGNMPTAVTVVAWGVGVFVLFYAFLGQLEVCLILAGLAMREAYARKTKQTVQRWTFNSIIIGILPTLPTWMGNKWPLIVAVIIHLWVWNSLPWVTHGAQVGDDANHDGVNDAEADMPKEM